jgi:hypothetical protein
MGFAPPPIDWDVVEKMTPAQRLRFLQREEAFLQRCAADQAVMFWLTLPIVLILASLAGAIAFHWWHLV